MTEIPTKEETLALRLPTREEILGNINRLAMQMPDEPLQTAEDIERDGKTLLTVLREWNAEVLLSVHGLQGGIR